MEVVWTRQTSFLQKPLAESSEPVFVLVAPNGNGSGPSTKERHAAKA